MLSLQTAAVTWPATADLEDQTVSILDAFEYSTEETRIDDDEEEEDQENSNPNLTGVNNTSLF